MKKRERWNGNKVLNFIFSRFHIAKNFKCRLSLGLETCFYPIFNDRAAKGATVANEG